MLELIIETIFQNTGFQTNHMVTGIKPLENDRWQVTAIYKPTNTKIVKDFDSVIICNGHYNQPTIPKFEGQEKFRGEIFHSHKYRSAKRFTGLRVLVVGAGPSGLDMALHISKVAEKVNFEMFVNFFIKYKNKMADLFICLLR